MPRIEDVRRLQGSRQNPLFEEEAISPLDESAKYSINPRALRKWSGERLHLKFLEDESVEAKFIYEGTTCSNLGRPLEYNYFVKLSAPSSGYRLIDAKCLPAAGDTGHGHMCEFIANADKLVKSMEREKPLLGAPLNDVLHWKRAYHPAACYCDADSRNHKWGLVLEVIHYALVQHRQNTKSLSNNL